MSREIENDEKIQQEGWVCPICKNVINPKVKQCPTCAKKSLKEGSNGGKEVLFG